MYWCGGWRTINRQGHNTNPPPHTEVATQDQMDDMLEWRHGTFIDACKDTFPRRRAAPVNPDFTTKGKGQCDDIARKQVRLNRIISAINQNRLSKVRQESHQIDTLVQSLECDYQKNTGKDTWPEFVRKTRRQRHLGRRQKSRW